MDHVAQLPLLLCTLLFGENGFNGRILHTCSQCSWNAYYAKMNSEVQFDMTFLDKVSLVSMRSSQWQKLKTFPSFWTPVPMYNVPSLK